MKRGKYLRYLILIFLIVLATQKIFSELPSKEDLKLIFQNINYFWVLLALISQTGQYIGDGLLSKELLFLIDYKIGLKDTFRIAALNVFSAHILPIGEAGALTTSYYFYHKLGVKTKDFIFLSISWSVITNIVLAIIFLTALPFLPLINIPLKLNLNNIFAAIAIILTLTFSYLKRKSIWHWLKKSFNKFQWFGNISDFVQNRSEYKNRLTNNPKIIFICFWAAAIYYISNILTLSFSFLAFGSFPSFAIIIFAYTISLVSGWVTLAPAGIGATESVLFIIFLASGMDTTTSIATIFLFRLISFWLPIPTGFLSFVSLTKKERAIINE
jgi:uncharacterized protein (TIRG00374 family)